MADVRASTPSHTLPRVLTSHRFSAARSFRFLATALCFVSDYHPGSVTVHSRYFAGKPFREAEDVLWSYICQIVSALCSIHSAKLACRIVDQSHRIIITDRNRIRLNLCGAMDALGIRPPNKSLPELQFETAGALVALARIAAGAGQRPLPEPVWPSL